MRSIVAQSRNAANLRPAKSRNRLTLARAGAIPDFGLYVGIAEQYRDQPDNLRIPEVVVLLHDLLVDHNGPERHEIRHDLRVGGAGKLEVVRCGVLFAYERAKAGSRTVVR